MRLKRLFWTVSTFTAVAMLAGAIIGCGGWNPDPNPPTNPCDKCSPEQTCVDGECVDPLPPYTDSCQALLDEGMPWCEPGTPCGDCVHNPSTDPRHCEKLKDCDVPPVEPPLDPPPPNEENMWFPIVPQDQITIVRGNPGDYGSALNKAMAELTGCAVGQEPCPVSLHVDLWFQAVCKQLHAGVRVGDEVIPFHCGRHIESPLGEKCAPGGNCSDQISVKRGSFCDGNFHENYRVINPAENAVRWYPSAKLDGWNVDCTGATWPEDPDGTEPPPIDPPPIDPPPGQTCPLPHPNLLSMKFKCVEHNGILDCTWITVSQEPFCREIGMSPMADGTPRAGCPVRPEGNPEREPCETELCSPKWTCNGEPYPPYRGNPAQSNCRGHWKTYCSVAGSTAMAEGDR